MRSFNKIIAVLLVMVMTLTMLPVSAFTASAATTSDPAPSVSAAIKRLGGADRYETSTKIAQEGWTSADTVVLASADSYADALAGAPLARAKDAPIMLVSGKSVNAKVMAQIKALGAKTVYLMGGTAAISAEIEAELTKAGYTVIRLWDSTRYGTAVAVAKELVKINGTPSEVFIASGVNYPDALSASSIAGIKGVPILYAPANGVLDDATIAFIKSAAPGKAFILGGTAAIDNAVVGKLNEAGVASTERLGGDDRYDTSLIITKKFDSVFTSKDISIATGKNHPDALAGGAFSAKKGIPVLLTDNATVNSDLKAYIAAKDPAVAYVFGGDSVVSDAIVKAYLPVLAPTTTTTESTTTTTTTTAAPSVPVTPTPSVTRYKVSFDANGDNVENMPSAQNVKRGKCATEPAEPTREGYTFEGWYTEAECVNEFDFATKITKKITLYAKWEENESTINPETPPLDPSTVDDYYADEIIEELKPKNNTVQHDLSDESSPITEVLVDYTSSNGEGSVDVSDCTDTSYLSKTAGAVGSPINLLMVGDSLEKATIRFRYDPSKLGSIKPSNLGIAWYDDNNDIMMLLENVILDEEKSEISVETTHFSQYVVVDSSVWFENWTKNLPIIRDDTSSGSETYFNILLSIDASGSMSGSNNTLSKEAAIGFVEQLKENDILTVQRFESNAYDVIIPGYIGETTMDSIKNSINSIYASGGTSFDNALSSALSSIDSMNTLRKGQPHYGGPAAIKGKVINEDGAPIEGIKVTAYVNDGSLSSLNNVVAETITNSDGEYRLDFDKVYSVNITFSDTANKYTSASVRADTLKDKIIIEPDITLYEVLPITGRDDNIFYTNLHNYNIKQLLILLSDGESSVSSSVLNNVIASGCQVVTIGLGQGASASVLRNIAESTGGQYFHANSANELNDLYELIAGSYVGIDTDTDGDGLPDIVEKQGMRNQFGEIMTTDPDDYDTDGDGYSDGEEIGSYDGNKACFRIVSDPCIPTYVSDQVKYLGSKCQTQSAKLNTQNPLNSDFSWFKLSVKSTFARLVRASDFLSETVYQMPGDLPTDIKKDNCISLTENHSIKSDGYYYVYESEYLCKCENGGIGCKAKEHELAVSFGNPEMFCASGSFNPAEEWVKLYYAWLNEYDLSLRKNSVAVIEKVSEIADADYNKELPALTDVVQIAGYSNSSGNQNTQKQLETMVTDLIVDALSAFDTEIMLKLDDHLDIGYNVVNEINKHIHGGDKSKSKLVVGTKTFDVTLNNVLSFNSAGFFTIECVCGTESYTFMATSGMENALKKYIDSLEELFDSAMQEIKDILEPHNIALDTLDLVGATEIFDELLDPAIISYLDKKTIHIKELPNVKIAGDAVSDLYSICCMYQRVTNMKDSLESNWGDDYILDSMKAQDIREEASKFMKAYNEFIS